MENNISWTAEVGKDIFLKRLKSPKTIISLFVGIIIAISLINKLVAILLKDLNINPPITCTIIIVLLVVLFIYVYKTNSVMLGGRKILEYTITNQGVSLNNKLYLWENYQYFQDEYLLKENVTPAVLKGIKPDVFIISLLTRKYSDKDKLVLIMEDQETYKRVSRVVGLKLKDALNLK